MASPTTSDEFFQLVTKSELVDTRRMHAFLHQLKEAGVPLGDPMESAQLLICEGLLTPFQAKLLIQGKWRNFFIGSKYKVLEHLGDGGMGSVFLCEHRHMRRRVAVKILPIEKSRDPNIIKRFLREAQAVAMMNHPNIVRAHDIDKDGPVYYIVMEYVEGVNLQQLVDNHGPLTVDRAVNYLVQTAGGLQHAHTMGLVHRDIKPANLLLDRTGVLKILDLGLARITQQESQHELTRMNDKAILGTADYLAPEQAIDASTCDIRADIYSLGATLYTLLLGRPMFDEGTVAQKLIWHQTMDPPAVDSIRRDVPSELAKIMKKMVAKKPIDRFQNPADIYAALQPWFVPVPPPTDEEMPATRFSSHSDHDTVARSRAGDTMGATMHGTSRASATLADFRIQ